MLNTSITPIEGHQAHQAHGAPGPLGLPGRKATRTRPIRPYQPTYLPTYLPTYIPTYIHKYLHTCIRSQIHTYVRTYIHTWGFHDRLPKSKSKPKWIRVKHAYTIKRPKLILYTYIGHSGFEARSKLINCVLWPKDPASIYRRVGASIHIYIYVCTPTHVEKNDKSKSYCLHQQIDHSRYKGREVPWYVCLQVSTKTKNPYKGLDVYSFTQKTQETCKCMYVSICIYMSVGRQAGR